jgi:BCCT family betaine/carnitine transporter
MTAANIFVWICLFLVVSPDGRIRLGGPDARPNYSYAGWFRDAVRRRHGHRADVLRRSNRSITSRTRRSASTRRMSRRRGQIGMAATIFHWGLHPWAIFAVVALGLASLPAAAISSGLPFASCCS